MTDLALGLAGPGARALLIGTGTVADPAVLPPVPAVHRTLVDLRAILLRRTGLSEDRIRVLEDPEDARTIGQAVTEAAKAASDTLLLYYVGHGLVGAANELRLCTRETTGDADTDPFTTASFRDLAALIRRHRPTRFVIVLDCCHAERAGDESLTAFRHHYLLAAAARDQRALAPVGDVHTAFTGELIRLLHSGDPHGPEVFTLEELRRALADRDLSPRARHDAPTAWFGFARNPAARAEPAAEPTGHDTGVCPYPGLSAYDETTQHWFRGRDRLTGKLVREVTRADGPGEPVVLLGASGSGKSSLIRAGLLTELRRSAIGNSPDTPGHWRPLVCTPTAAPLRALAETLSGPARLPVPAVERTLAHDAAELVRRLARPEAPVLLAVDQFEEVFSLCEDETDRAAFIRAIAALATTGATPSAPVRVVLAVAAPYYASCAEWPELAHALSGRQILVTPLSAEEVREAITEPARQEHLRVQEGLVELILTDLGYPRAATPVPEPGSPPHPFTLAHFAQALTATWRRRERGVLTVRGYQECGGLSGAIAQAADSVYQDLGSDNQQLARILLLRMVRPGRPLEGVPPARRPVDRAELVRELGGGRADALLGRFLAKGLVVEREGAVQPAHDAVLHAWPRMRAWLAADPVWRLHHEQLTAAARAWTDSQGDEADLYRGHTLARALEQVEGRPRLEVGEDVWQFLNASVARQRSAARRSRRRRRTLLVLAITTALCVIAAVAALWTARDAHRAGSAAEDADTSRRLAAASRSVAPTDPPLAGRLAVAAYRSAPTDEAWAAMIAAAGGWSNASDSGDDGGRIPGGVSVEFSPHHDLLAINDGQGLCLWDTAARRLLGALGTPGIGPAVKDMAFSPDGRRIALLLPDGTVQIWHTDKPSGPPVDQIVMPGPTQSGASWVSFGPGGRTVAVAMVTGGDANRATGITWVTPLPGKSEPRRLDHVRARYTAGGRLLIGLEDGGRLRVTRVSATGATRHTERLPRRPSPYRGTPAVAAQGGTLAVAYDDGLVEVHDITEGGRVRPRTRLRTNVSALALSPDGRLLAVQENDGPLTLWDVTTGDDPVPLTSRPGVRSTDERGLAFSRDGGLLAAITKGGTALGDIRSARQPAVLADIPVPDGGPTAVALSADGRVTAIGTRHGTVALRSVDGRSPRAPTGLADPTGHPVVDLAFAADRRTLMVTRGSGVELWDSTRPSARRPLAVLPGARAAVAVNAPVLLTRAPGGVARLWRITRPERPDHQSDLDESSGTEEAVALTPDGRTAYTGAWWNVRRADRPHVMSGPGSRHGEVDPSLPTGAMHRVSLAPHTGLLAEARSPYARTWTDEPGRTLEQVAHPGTVLTGLAVSPDGRLAATGDDEGGVRLHSGSATAGWHPLADFRLRGAPISALAVGRGGVVAVASEDGRVRVSDVSPGALQKRLCRGTLPVDSAAAWTAHASGDLLPEDCGA
ncbi:caspase, EACC1-associated type [Streptomyces coffeae]|uniref:Caspase family protein n=1 Tax=Streptomyces coffeae TaxID=621382 RepID=A0ABS1NJS5_9ACTN|nr:AAA family ATPase [Streptomyces coffeae]MBL1100291.1 caspase family protein [Streptomyces coffeae]